MAIAINPSTFVITVPKADLTLIQSSPTEIRELNLNTFRMWLKSWEDSVDGMTFLKTHDHNPEVTVGGLTLARVVNILDPYTITFEDGQYAVNLVGANSNVGDKVNVNQVSVRSQNSAGMTSSPAIEYASYGGGVTIDVTSNYIGTLYPIGTSQQPVNNINDALLICETRGFDKLFVIGDLTVGLAGEVDSSGIPVGISLDNFKLVGESQTKTLITIEEEASVLKIEVSNASVTGILDGNSLLEDCFIKELYFMDGLIIDCILGDEIITLAGGVDSHFLNCKSGVVGPGVPTIDMGGAGRSLGIRDYNGGIEIINKTGPESINLDVNSGQIILDSTVSNGNIIIRGIGSLTDNSTGTAVIDSDNLMSKATVSQAVWDEPIADHLVPGSSGLSLGIDQFAGYVTISTSGVSGTEFPIGTEGAPVDNIADAITIATTRSLHKLRFTSNFTFTNTISISNYELYGATVNTILTFTYGCTLLYCKAINCTVTGSCYGLIVFTDCIISNYTDSGLSPSNQDIFLKDCFLKDEMAFPSNYSGKLQIISSCSIGAEETSDQVSFNMGGSNCTTLIKNYTGSFNITNNTQSNIFSIDMNVGRIYLDNSITAGTFKIRGNGIITNDTTGSAIVNTDGLMNKTTVSEAVWNELVTDHVQADSFGKTVNKIKKETSLIPALL